MGRGMVLLIFLTSILFAGNISCAYICPPECGVGACISSGIDFSIDCNRRNLTEVPVIYDPLGYYPQTHNIILDMANNNISSVPAEAFRNLTTLHTLILSENTITSFDNDWAATVNSTIKRLFLNENRLTMAEIQKALSSVAPTLEWLSISGNPITLLDRNLLEKFDHLAVLKADNCLISHIESLNSSTRLFTSLEWLTLSNNRLSTLPDQLALFGELETLVISGNNISSFPISFKSPGNLANLKNLDVSRNKLVYTPRRVMQLHPNLISVNLSHNVIVWIGANTTYYSSSLVDLDLSHNEISNIEIDALRGIQNGTRINLDNNRIFTLYNDLFPYDSVGGVSLSFRDNPYLCNCYGNWIHRIMGTVSPARCQSDPSITIFFRDDWPCNPGASATTSKTTVVSQTDSTIRHNRSSSIPISQTISAPTTSHSGEATFSTQGPPSTISTIAVTHPPATNNDISTTLSVTESVSTPPTSTSSSQATPTTTRVNRSSSGMIHNITTTVDRSYSTSASNSKTIYIPATGVNSTTLQDATTSNTQSSNTSANSSPLMQTATDNIRSSSAHAFSSTAISNPSSSSSEGSSNFALSSSSAPTAQVTEVAVSKSSSDTQRPTTTPRITSIATVGDDHSSGGDMALPSIWILFLDAIVISPLMINSVRFL